MQTSTETNSVQAGVVDDQPGKAPSKFPLINKTAVREYALDYCKRSPRSYVRSHMTRVSEQLYVEANSMLKEWIRKKVDSQPSTGVTIT